MSEIRATPEPPCAACLRRSWLIARMSGHIELAWRARRPLPAVLALPDEQLIAALGGDGRARIEQAYETFAADLAIERCSAAGLVALCRCDARYPGGLNDLSDPPAVVYLLGRGAEQLWAGGEEAVALVGARRATPYGLTQARSLGRGLASAGVTVVSGMALGVDASAHAGALESAGGLTVAVLAGGADRPYPASKRALHRRIAAAGVVISEMPPGTQARRWCFPARNRIIAALACATVVVEAGERSGSLITATLAAEIGRDVGAVPGLVTSPFAAGTNGLIAEGARLVRGPQDVLEMLFGAEAPQLASARQAEQLPGDLRELLARVAGGMDTVAALTADGVGLDAALAGLAQLELQGHVRRTAGGRYATVA
ncbi:MAG: protecting protein DprA [Conexibacter sp.]|nr:protecting protein DprA [Conexibacter sp.]